MVLTSIVRKEMGMMVRNLSDEFLHPDKYVINKLENELKPGGRWCFPPALAELVVGLVGEAEKQPVLNKNSAHTAEKILANWDRQLLQKMASNISRAYKDNRGSVDYDTFWQAYAIYYLPANFTKVIRVLFELLVAGMLPRQAKVLDLGAGPGTVSLAVLFFYHCLFRYTGANISLEIDLVDRSDKQLAVAKSLLAGYGNILKAPFSVVVGRVVAGCLEKSRQFIAGTLGNSRYNLIFLANVLNEYEIRDINKNKQITDFALSYLTGNGTLAILEPATESCARRLADLHWRYKSHFDGIKAGAFGPCAYPWGVYPNRHCRCFCWSNVSEPWQKPGIIACLENYGVPRRNEIKYSYLLLRRDNRNKFQHLRNPVGYRQQGFVKLSRIGRCLNRDVSILGVAIHVYRKGDLQIIVLCDGTAGCQNYCHLETGSDTTPRVRQMLANVRHGEMLELVHVRVVPGSRRSRYTLMATEQTELRRHHGWAESYKEVM